MNLEKKTNFKKCNLEEEKIAKKRRYLIFGLLFWLGQHTQTNKDEKKITKKKDEEKN